MALIKNAIVKMDWDSEGFYEHKATDTFIAAVNEYSVPSGKLAVIFMNGKAFLLYDEETEAPVTRDDFTKFLHDMVDVYGPDVVLEDTDECAEIYIELSNGVEVDSELAESYGLSEEDCEDINARIEDLSGYTEVTYEDM